MKFKRRKRRVSASWPGFEFSMVKQWVSWVNSYVSLLSSSFYIPTTKIEIHFPISLFPIPSATAAPFDFLISTFLKLFRFNSTWFRPFSPFPTSWPRRAWRSRRVCYRASWDHSDSVPQEVAANNSLGFLFFFFFLVPF